MSRARAVRELTLVVPGLPPPGSGGPAVPAKRLGTLLARADRGPDPEAGLAAALFGLFDRLPPAGGDLPVAAASRWWDAERSEQAWWWRADPVHLIADRDRVVLSGPEALALCQEEADALVAEIMAQFRGEGWRLEAAAPNRWYLGLPRPVAVRTTPLEAVRGRGIDGCLPRGAEAGRWRAILTEVQMLLHASPVNAARERRGLPAVNSLWLWGGGVAPAPRPAAWQGVWSDEALARGLAGLDGVPHEPLPEGAASWLGRTQAPGRYLVVMEAGLAAMRSADLPAWTAFIAHLEQAWVAPLVQAVAGGRLARLELRPLAGRGYVLRRGDWRRWWRRVPANYR